MSDQHHESLRWEEANGALERAGCDNTGDGGIVTEWTLRVRNPADYRRSTIECVELATDGELRGDLDREEHFSYDGSGTDRSTSSAPHRLVVGVDAYLDFRNFGALKIFDVALLDASVPDVIGQTGAFQTRSRATYDRAQSPAYELLCRPGYVVTGIDVIAKHGAGGPNQAEIRGVRLECSRLRQNAEVNSISANGVALHGR